MIEGASVDNDEKEYQLIEGPLHKRKILIHTYSTPVVKAQVIRHVGKQVKS